MASVARPERRSQANRRDEAEQKMLRAAVCLVAEQGLERITLTDVGEAAGYSRGLPAHYFGNKAGLIVQLAQHMIDEFGRALDGDTYHQPGLARLLEIVAFYLESSQRDVLGTRALFVLLGEGVSNPLISDKLAALNMRSVEAIAVHIRAAIAAGEVAPDIDANTMAFLTLAALRGTVGLWLMTPQAVHFAAARDAFVAALERSLTR